MKKQFAYGAIFLVIYLMFLVAMVPASWVLSQITLPKNLLIEGVSGSIWHSKISRLRYQKIDINDIDSRLSVLSLLMANPKVVLTFGSDIKPGPDGKLSVSGLLNELVIEDATLAISANMIAQQLPLPIPMQAHATVDVAIVKFEQGNSICQTLEGNISWRKAGLTALNEKVNLGNLQAALSCEDNQVIATINPKNNLGLTFAAYLSKNGRAHGNGYLKPTKSFPAQLREVLPFIGQPDNQGRYRLKF